MINFLYPETDDGLAADWCNWKHGHWRGQDSNKGPALTVQL